MKVSRRSNYILFAGASALALSAGAPAAFAQDEDGARTLSTVVVTTQKTEESIQDVPIAVNAFTGEDLQARGVLDVMDMQQVTPSLSINDSNSTSGLRIFCVFGSRGALPVIRFKSCSNVSLSTMISL